MNDVDLEAAKRVHKCSGSDLDSMCLVCSGERSY